MPPAPCLSSGPSPESPTLDNFAGRRTHLQVNVPTDYGSLRGDRFCSLRWAHFAARRLMNRSFN